MHEATYKHTVTGRNTVLYKYIEPIELGNHEDGLTI